MYVSASPLMAFAVIATIGNFRTLDFSIFVACSATPLGCPLHAWVRLRLPQLQPLHQRFLKQKIRWRIASFVSAERNALPVHAKFLTNCKEDRAFLSAAPQTPFPCAKKAHFSSLRSSHELRHSSPRSAHQSTHSSALTPTHPFRWPLHRSVLEQAPIFGSISARHAGLGANEKSAGDGINLDATPGALQFHGFLASSEEIYSTSPQA
jgi:hypothetical protein